MADARRRLNDSTDEALAGALRDLGTLLAFPSAGGQPGQLDIAARARIQIVALDVRPSAAGGRRFGLRLRPMRRGLVLALAALLILAAIAGAVGLGLPGLRIIFSEAPSLRPSPSASATSSQGSGASPTATATPSPRGPLGSDLGLGTAMPLGDVQSIAGFDLILPTDPAIGPPDVAYLAGRRATLVWAARPGLPATGDHGVGLLISQFQGHVEDGYYNKILDVGTNVTPVKVGGSSGYWISGPPHFFYYIDPNGDIVDDGHREVGDVLIWATDEVTYRLESGLDMAGAIRLAETLK